LALLWIDLQHQLLPDNIVLPMLWLGLLLNLFSLFVPLTDAVIGAIAGYLSLWLLTYGYKFFTGKVGMGHGDFKFLAMWGAWLGWKMLPFIIFSSAFVGMLFGITIIILKKQSASTPIPFGPYLTLGGITALFWGNAIMQAYFHVVMP
jgi:leader peptidase (prepilin peptidase)/N-methyltransferase